MNVDAIFDRQCGQCRNVIARGSTFTSEDNQDLCNRCKPSPTNSRLEAKVRAVNAANEYANQLYVELADAFQPFVGQSILKTDGSLLKKVEAVIPKFVHTNRVSVYRYLSKFSLVYVVKTYESYDEHSCVYHEASVYVGTLDGSKLIGLCNAPKLRSSYDAREVAALRADHDAAKKAASDALSALNPFGEYDR